MRLALIPTLSLAALALTACVGSTPSIKVQPVASIHLVQPDSALTKDCASPIALPDKALDQEDTENGWSTDRGSLVSCRKSKAAVVKFYRDRDAALMASTK